MWRHVTVTVEDDGFWPLEIVASTTEADNSRRLLIPGPSSSNRLADRKYVRASHFCSSNLKQLQSG